MKSIEKFSELIQIYFPANELALPCEFQSEIYTCMEANLLIMKICSAILVRPDAID